MLESKPILLRKKILFLDFMNEYIIIERLIEPLTNYFVLSILIIYKIIWKRHDEKKYRTNKQLETSNYFR